jgi:methionyl-tRNA formyltransferase
MRQTKTFKIVILSDSMSWINSTVEVLVADWKQLGHEVFWFDNLRELPSADFCFCLSFSQIIPRIIRQQFKHTLVVHESDLPAGKGWSPLTWQILEGKNRIPITLFEAVDEVDSGSIYAQRWIEFEGHELVDELREGQAKATKEICQWFVDHYPESLSEVREQQGLESFYPRRGLKDSQLDPNKTIAEQFNLLRVVDNERYPAFFYLNGRRFYLKVSEYGISK